MQPGLEGPRRDDIRCPAPRGLRALCNRWGFRLRFLTGSTSIGFTNLRYSRTFVPANGFKVKTPALSLQRTQRRGRGTRVTGLVADACCIQLDAEDAGAGGDVERFGVGVAPGYVGDAFGNFDRAQMLALGRNDPNPAGA